MDPLRHVKPAVRRIQAYTLAALEAPVKINHTSAAVEDGDQDEGISVLIPLTAPTKGAAGRDRSFNVELVYVYERAFRIRSGAAGQPRSLAV